MTTLNTLHDINIEPDSASS